ncbi:MAG: hypothetical protein ACJAZ6_001460 [Oleispira sp.]|jgi:hypothetical protein|tara:strand:+ start:1769 stop:2128 length:360 start_codon:yes stop_codon:yes gene_type:complete
MKLSSLMKYWEKEFSGQLSEEGYEIKLSLEDAARLEALCEMFPKYPQENLLRDLISSALTEVTSSFPYVKGKEVVALDEEGDPMYADVGPTPNFLSLTRKHLKLLNESKLNQSKKASAH